MTPGKLAGLRAVSDARGVFAAVAMDQRGLLRQMMASAVGSGEALDDAIAEFKRLVAEELCQEASAILLDLQYGLEAARAIRGHGLLLAYEHAGYTAEHPERLPSLYEGWSALRLKEAGAHAVKILVYYNPFEQEWVNDRKKAWVERIGAECRAIDLPLFLEFLGYDVSGHGEKSREYARLKPEIVMRSVEEFTRERYAADVLKIDVPVEMQHVEGTAAFRGDKLHSRAEAMQLMRDAAALTGKPIVYLSAGVGNEVFVETLQLAAEAGVPFHGVLAGRAIWQEGVPVYMQQGPDALRNWLRSTGIVYLRAVKQALGAARPWLQAPSMEKLREELSLAGPVQLEERLAARECHGMNASGGGESTCKP